MSEILRPIGSETQTIRRFEDTLVHYGVEGVNKNRLLDCALDILNEIPSEYHGKFLNNPEKVLFFLSNINTHIDNDSLEHNFNLPSTQFERRNAFNKRLGLPTEKVTLDLSMPFFQPEGICFEESEAYDKDLREWGKNTLLDTTREKFSITAQNELLYKVVVSDLFENDFRKEYQSGGFATYNTSDGIPLIYLHRGTDDNVLIHEYIHTQFRFPGLVHGDLGRGIEEGIVESNTPDPQAYPLQREAYDYLVSQIPDLNELISLSRNDKWAKDEIHRKIISEFGLTGLNYVIRISPDAGKNAQKFYAKDMYDYMISPKEATAALATLKRRHSATIASR